MSCCKQNDQGKKAAASDAPEAGPMAMGMAMARKMMGQGGNPMEMMQKMMAQMGQADGPPPMQQMMGMCMSMCSEMLAAIRQTTALAAFATPGLQHVFGTWLKDIEAKAEASVAEGAKDAAALAVVLGIDEASAHYVLGRLAADGKVTLVAHSRT